ncbi:transmembrane adaptor Erv26 protein [Rutstroemia sp. NJR-2017a BBW]|nr:transmembrane adaptor Erv26 protein [Rutstroemia sp. NJR-2017a BBW]
MAVGFGFLTLAIASGLYYLSELVEEHTVMAKRFLTRMIYGIIGLQILLCLIDGFSFKLSALSVFSHVVYLGNMRRFPIVRLSDPLFITSCERTPSNIALHPALVVINHYLWFVHFSSGPLPPTQSIYDAPQYPDFTQIASYFGLCVWMTPFALFVSLSASDNVLPTMGSEEPGMAGKDKASGRQGMAKVIVDAVRNGITELGRSVGWFKEDRGF